MGSCAYEELLSTLIKIKGGSRPAREKLIAEYRPFVLKTANQFFKRSLEWGRDDELSIGLIAFNSAIDTFDPGKQVPFLPYCKVVIVNRLKDHVRKESRYQNQSPLDDESLSLESRAAWDDYVNRTIEDERRDELERFENVLSGYEIGFADLVEVSPRHRDYRLTLFKVAGCLAHENSLMECLIRKKQLPLVELGKTTGVNRKTLERGRKFIIAAALILSKPDEFVYLRSYVDFG
jgi:RNA polymerase sigma factor